MDIGDLADGQAQPILDALVADARNRAESDKVPFIAGECEVCEEDSARLVHSRHPKDGPVWACARCRDKYKLPTIRSTNGNT